MTPGRGDNTIDQVAFWQQAQAEQAGAGVTVGMGAAAVVTAGAVGFVILAGDARIQYSGPGPAVRREVAPAKRPAARRRRYVFMVDSFLR
jgi:hypothetical protein